MIFTFPPLSTSLILLHLACKLRTFPQLSWKLEHSVVCNKYFLNYFWFILFPAVWHLNCWAKYLSKTCMPLYAFAISFTCSIFLASEKLFKRISGSAIKHTGRRFKACSIQAVNWRASSCVKTLYRSCIFRHAFEVPYPPMYVSCNTIW